MAKRKYTKRNVAYWQELSKARKYSVNYEGSALQRYHQAQREAKQYGGAYADYVKAFYSISKKLRTKKVSLKGLPDPEVLTYQQFERKTIKTAKSQYQIVKQQFGLIAKANATELKQKLTEAGFRISVERAQARQLSIKEWDFIHDHYNKLLRAGLRGKNAKIEIAQYFFGSP